MDAGRKMRAYKRTETPATADSEARRVRDGGERRQFGCTGAAKDSDGAARLAYDGERRGFHGRRRFCTPSR